MRAILTRDEMRAADAAALASVSHETLVDRAGTAVAHAALHLCGGAYGRRIVVVVGKGSNGADGKVAADVLARRGARVHVVEATSLAPGAALPQCDLVIDGAYGTGFRGSYDAPAVPPGAQVLAIDIPSGVDADSGDAPGDAVQADATVTFAALKPGLLQGAGARLSGHVEVADIGIGFETPKVMLVEDADVARWCRGGGVWATSGTTRSASRPVRAGWKVRPSCAPGGPWPPARG